MSAPPVYRITPTLCPWCGRLLDAATGVAGEDNEDNPEAGDLVVCIGCGAVLVIRVDGGLAKPAEDEVKQLTEADPDLAKELDLALVAWARMAMAGKLPPDPGRLV